MNGIDHVATIPTPRLASSKHAISFLLNDTEVFPLAVAPAVTTPVTINIAAPCLASSSSVTPQSPVHSFLVATTSATAISATSSSTVAPSHGRVPQRLEVKHEVIGPYPGMGLFDPYERLLVPLPPRKRWKLKPVRKNADGH